MLEFVTLENPAELDAFVRRHAQGHFMQTSRWGRYKSDWQWRGILCRASDGGIRGSMAILMRRFSHTPLRLLYAPRGPIAAYGDFETVRELLDGAKQLAHRCGGCLLRIDPQYIAEDGGAAAAFRALGFSLTQRDDFSAFQARLVYQLRLTGSAEEMLAACHSKTRYNIRLAQRRGVTIVRGGSVADFHAQLCASAGRNGFSPKPAADYARLLDCFGEDARIYLAKKEDAVEAAAIRIQMGEKAWFYAGGSAAEFRADMPNYLLQWTMIEDAIRENCKLYDFRGVVGFPAEDNPHFGLHRFKAGFGAGFVEFLGQLDYTYAPALTALLHRAGRI